MTNTDYSLSSESVTRARGAPARTLFSYEPQQFPMASQAVSNDVFSSQPLPYVMSPATPRRVSAHMKSRSASHQSLSVNVAPDAFSSYPMPQPTQMTRAGTQPLPLARPMVAYDVFPSMPSSPIYQQSTFVDNIPMQSQRIPTRRLRESPSTPRSQPFSTAPLRTVHPPPVTVHPPPATYALSTEAPSTPRRVHPPPHPGPSSGSGHRVIARMPSTPLRRKASGSPSKTPSKPRRVASQPAFGFGFVNYTPDDAEKLLSGVARSGSQPKRRRDDAPAPAMSESSSASTVDAVDATAHARVSYEGSEEGEHIVRRKRSRSND